MFKEINTSQNYGTKSIAIFSGILYTLIIVLFSSLLISLFISFTNLSDYYLAYVAYAVNAISVFFGGLIAGRKRGERGLFYGGVTGIFYGLFLYLIGMLGFDAFWEVRYLIYIIAAFLFGASGGIIGVNMRK